MAAKYLHNKKCVFNNFITTALKKIYIYIYKSEIIFSNNGMN